MASLSKPDPGIAIDKMQKAGILAMPFGNMVKCQIQDHQVIQGQVVSVWKKQIQGMSLEVLGDCLSFQWTLLLCIATQQHPLS